MTTETFTPDHLTNLVCKSLTDKTIKLAMHALGLVSHNGQHVDINGALIADAIGAASLSVMASTQAALAGTHATREEWLELCGAVFDNYGAKIAASNAASMAEFDAKQRSAEL